MLAYSTSTDGTIFVSSEVKDSDEFRAYAGAYDQDWCAICSRATSHFAEHDDLVEQGLAVYMEGVARYTEAGHAWKAALEAEGRFFQYALSDWAEQDSSY